MTDMSIGHLDRRLKLVGLLAMVASVLIAISAGIAAPAHAESWLVNDALVFSESPIVWEGHVKISGGEFNTTIECKEEASGYVWKFGISKITADKFSNCSFAPRGEYCETPKEPGMELAHLGVWGGLLSGKGKENTFAPEDGISPGFKLKCEQLGIYISWECLGKIQTSTTNITTGVTTAFNNKEELSCEFSGTKSTAKVSGTGEMRFPNHSEILSADTEL